MLAGEVKEKPHKGRIIHWRKYNITPRSYAIAGYFLDHPQFAGNAGHTSPVIKHAPDGEIITKNSRYTLIGEPLGV